MTKRKKMEEESLKSVKRRSSSAPLCWKGGERSTQGWSRRAWESREGKGVKGVRAVKSREKKAMKAGKSRNKYGREKQSWGEM